MKASGRCWARAIALVGFWALAASASAAAPAGSQVVRERAELTRRYTGELKALAESCREKGLKTEAERTAAWIVPRQPDRIYLFLPADDLQAEVDPKADRGRLKQLLALRKRQAESLFSLAKRALAEGRSSLACELVLETLHENPDHEQARRALGYARFRGAWHTPYEIRQLTAGKVDDPRFGWLPKAHVARYEKGQRFYQSRWMSRDDEVRRRADAQHGWRLESEHYVVTTAHSLEEGVRLSGELERLHRFWETVFVGYLATPAELTRRFAGAATKPLDARRHNVVQYGSREEYNTALRAQAKIEITVGIYFDTSRTAYFFVDPEQGQAALFHEATHQLFAESRPAMAKNMNRSQNFWIVEGIACYMETLEPHGAYYTLGAADAGRIPAARSHVVDDRFYLPLAEFAAMGMSELQGSAEIAKLYSQATGLAAFLMQYDDGRYRETVPRFLTAIYSGRDDRSTLSTLTGASASELDRQYRRFAEDLPPVKIVDESAAHAAPTAPPLNAPLKAGRPPVSLPGAGRQRVLPADSRATR